MNNDVNVDGIVDGCDVYCLNVEIGWCESWWIVGGLNFGVESYLVFDVVNIV